MAKVIVLDIESSFSLVTKASGKMESDIASPFNPDNKCILVGVYDRETKEYTSYDMQKRGTLPLLKAHIASASVLVAHNAKFDMLWLKALGIDLSHLKYRDTMLQEYLIYQGDHPPLGLTYVAPRYGGKPKLDFVGMCFDKNINTDEIPTFVLAQYLYEDVMNTNLVYEGQLKRKELQDQALYNKFYHDCLEAVIEMEWNGAKFNQEQLNSVSTDIEEMLFTAMGNLVELSSKYTDKDKFNPDSPAQLARIIYGLELKKEHKAEWEGFTSRFKPWDTGSQGKLDHYVEKCFNKLENSLHVKPDVSWLTDKKFLTGTGISTSSKVIDSMLAHGKLTKKQEEFVAAVQAYSKASTWKSSNLNGFIDGVRPDGYIHANFNMHTTSTRRFSGSSPNLQAAPREGTNPTKKLIMTRFDLGAICASDFKQLEFRIAGLLSGDKLLIEDVANEVDIHSHTATVAFGEKFTQAEGKERKELRQKAKTKTFEFQYGARPKTKIDQAIYDAFYGKYTRLKQWQEETIALVARQQKYVCPFTGVIFRFDNANHNNEFMWATKAVNYPVQFLADAINKAALIGMYQRIKGREDIKLILTVHDSDVLDAAPEAVDEAKQILKEEMEGVTKTFEKYFNKVLDIPLAVDVSSGGTWYDQN